MGLAYQTFSSELRRALDPRLPAEARGEAEAQFAETLRNAPIRDYPGYLLQLLGDIDTWKDPVLGDLAYAWVIPALREMVATKCLEFAEVSKAFEALMNTTPPPSSATWGQIAVALQAINNSGGLAIDLLRKIPDVVRGRVLREDTVRLIAAR